MTRRVILGAAVSLLLAGASQAQLNDGGLSQQMRRSMEQAFEDLYNASEGLVAPTQDSFEERVGKEKLDAFIDGSVVRLSLEPDGSFSAYALEGGELLSFNLGKASVELAGDEEWVDPWYKRVGSVEVPKKPQKLELNIRAGDSEVQVECHNKYGRTETRVTYYVGPLDGLFCMGLADAGEGDAEGDSEAVGP